MTIKAEHINEQLALRWDEPAGWVRVFKTCDHKLIGLRYIGTAFLFFCFAGIEALLIRVQLATPKNNFVDPDIYNQWFTMHGTLMMFFFATPMLFGFGNYFVPLMIGNRDTAFPRLNALGYWIFLFSGLFIYISSLFDIAPDGGWYGSTPLIGAGYSKGLNMDFWVLGLLFLGIGTSACAINFIVTILKLRASGMVFTKMPIFVWTVLIASIALMIAMPALNTANLLLFLERNFGFYFFDVAYGGKPLLWEHLFWVFGHLDIYIILLPSIGIISEIVQTFSRHRLVAHNWLIIAILMTGFLGVITWINHMFRVGSNQIGTSILDIFAWILIVPLIIQIFVWIMTIWSGSIKLDVPVLWVIGFLVTFLLGVLSILMYPIILSEAHIANTYFMMARFHLILLGGIVFPIFGAFYYWGPKMFGRYLNKQLGRLHFGLTFLGVHITFLPMFVLGLLGMPSRVYTYDTGQGWDIYNFIATIGAFILGFSVMVFICNVIYSIFWGKDASSNAWGGSTLEWVTATPPPSYNFEMLPVVTSRTPLWDEKHQTNVHMPTLFPQQLTNPDDYETISTSVQDATPEVIVILPQQSLLPILMAFMLLLIFIGLLLSVSWLVIIGIVGGIFCSVIWFFPHGTDYRLILS